MFWILTASVPGDDRVFTIGPKAEFPEPNPWTARGASPILRLQQWSKTCPFCTAFLRPESWIPAFFRATAFGLFIRSHNVRTKPFSAFSRMSPISTVPVIEIITKTLTHGSAIGRAGERRTRNKGVPWGVRRSYVHAFAALFTHASVFHIYFLGANRGQVSRVHFHLLSALNSTNAASYAG
jgi:hypothetical protein